MKGVLIFVAGAAVGSVASVKFVDVAAKYLLKKEGHAISVHNTKTDEWEKRLECTLCGDRETSYGIFWRKKVKEEDLFDETESESATADNEQGTGGE